MSTVQVIDVNIRTVVHLFSVLDCEVNHELTSSATRRNRSYIQKLPSLLREEIKVARVLVSYCTVQVVIDVNIRTVVHVLVPSFFGESVRVP